jgi:hypothetical protein
MSPRTLLLFCLLAGSAIPVTAQCAPSDISSQTLTVAVEPVSEMVKVGAPVLVRAVLTNTSSKDIVLWRERGAEYHVDVRDEEGNLAPDTKLGFYKNGHVNLSTIDPAKLDLHYLSGSGVCFVLKPGVSLHDEVNVSRFYNMAKPGIYAVRVSTGGASAKQTVTSAVVTITVAP